MRLIDLVRVINFKGVECSICSSDPEKTAIEIGKRLLGRYAVLYYLRLISFYPFFFLSFLIVQQFFYNRINSGGADLNVCPIM